MHASMSDPSLRVAIGSARRPKVDAVKATFERLAPLFDVRPDAIEYLAQDADSGVDETPRSLERLMAGARNRAQALRHLLMQKERPVRFCVGLEGGLWSANGVVFLQSWAFVTDGERESFGSSGAIMVPAIIADSVFHRGESLGAVIDMVAEEENVRSNQGTWGILTKDRITRQQSFEVALLSALAPFYNSALYLHEHH